MSVNFRGIGVGPRLIRQACQQVMVERGLTKVLAYIRAENRNSAQAFLKAGFRHAGMLTHANQAAVVMEYTRENGMK